jgi:hypothetical protein
LGLTITPHGGHVTTSIVFQLAESWRYDKFIDYDYSHAFWRGENYEGKSKVVPVLN